MTQASNDGETGLYYELEEEKEELEGEIFEMQTERDNYNEEYARMNEENAANNYERVNEAIVDLDRAIQERRAEAEWQQKMVTQFDEAMNDPALDEYEEEEA